MLGATLETAFRVFLRRKFFTAASLFGIAFTLTVLLVATAYVDHFLWPREPEVNHRRSLGVFHASMKGEHWTTNGNPGWKLLHETLPNLPGVERTSIFTSPAETITYQGDRRVSFWLKRTDGAFWQVMRFRFLEGGPYGEADDREGRPVAVINASTRAKLFGGGPAVGRTFTLEDRTFRVVGVVADVPFLSIMPFSDVWVPTGTMKSDAYKEDLVGGFLATIVAKDPSQLAAIRAEYGRRVKALPLPTQPVAFQTLESEAQTLIEGILDVALGRGDTPLKIVLLLSVFGFLFVALPTVNLVNLSVSRILERAPEIGVRKAFGATSRALVAQFVAENVLLTLLGGALALAASAGVLALMNRIAIVPHAQFALNLRVFFAGLLLTLVFGVVSGAWPAWRMSRLHPVSALRGGV